MKTQSTSTTPRRLPARLVSRIALGASFLLVLQAAPPLLAADVTWSSTGTSTPGGDGNWTGGTTWWDGSSAVSWTDGDNAAFTAAGNTTVNSSVAVNQIAFTNSSNNISILNGAGDITLASGITARNDANTAARTFTISESIALGASQTWGVTNGAAVNPVGTANLLVSGSISGVGYGITKAGNGTLTLSGTNNTYTGTTTVSAGTLTLANTAANNKTIVGDLAISGGTLQMETANQIADTSSVTMTSGIWNLWANETISSVSVSGGQINARTAVLTSSDISLTGGTLAFGVRSATFTMNGPITLGNFSFNWASGAPLGQGIVIGGNMAVNDGTTANFAGGGRLTLNANRTIDVGTGANMNVQWAVVGTGYGITKNGAGTLTLSNANTYSGATTISNGTLVLGSAGSIANSSSINVASGATLNVSAVTGGWALGSSQTLSGSGTVLGNATINGNLQPGNSPGILSFSNDLTLGTTANTTMEILGDTTRGTDFDGINVTTLLTYDGTLSLSLGTTFGVGTYSFNLFDFGSQTGTFDTITLSGDYTGSLTNVDGNVWNLVDGDNTWTFTHSTGDLGLNVVPEPSTWALLALGVGVVALKIRRRCRRA